VYQDLAVLSETLDSLDLVDKTALRDSLVSVDSAVVQGIQETLVTAAQVAHQDYQARVEKADSAVLAGSLEQADSVEQAVLAHRDSLVRQGSRENRDSQGCQDSQEYLAYLDSVVLRARVASVGRMD
jgi:hypothetical protein